MNNLDKDYQALLQDILDNGVTKSDRTGTGTISVFGRQIRHKMSEGFPLLTTKKMHWKSIVTELLWFLRGETNIKYLVDNDCNIWTGDAYKNYHKQNDGILGRSDLWTLTKEEFINKIKTDDEFAKKWGDLGPIYGKQWRSWENEVNYRDEQLSDNHVVASWVEKENIDQIANLINDLKTNPDSRRLMVSAWNVGEIDQMVLPPCHYSWQVYTRELSQDERFRLYVKRDNPLYPLNVEDVDKYLTLIGIPTRAISLMWNQRSVDFGLGAPFNIASYGLLLGIIAKEVNMVPDELIGNLGDVHLYLDHVEPIKEQLNREPYPLPTLKIEDGFDIVSGLDDIYEINSFTLENYQSHPTIKLSLSN